MTFLDVKDSVLSRLNPLTKLVLNVVVCIHIIKNELYPSVIMISIYMLIYSILGKASFKKIEKMLRPIYVLTIISIIISSFVNRSFYSVIEPTVKLILIYTCGILFAFTTTSNSSISFFQTILKPLEYIKFPVNSLVLLLDTCLRFIPVVIDEAYRIINLQKIRGISFFKGKLKNRFYALKSFIIALFLQIFHMAEKVAQSIYIRQYSSKKPRSKYLRNKFRFIDFLIIIITIFTLYINKLPI